MKFNSNTGYAEEDSDYMQALHHFTLQSVVEEVKRYQARGTHATRSEQDAGFARL